jgi:Fur family transcriptional regulator, ferric uptake regulator
MTIGSGKPSADRSAIRDSVASTSCSRNTGPGDPTFLARELTARGVRMTTQRRMLLEIIAHSPDHLDAATLLRRAHERDGQIHRATVYRTLELLKRFRLIDELDLMHLEGEKHYYEPRNKSEHFHLACLGCGKIVEHITPTFERLKEEISEQTGFAIDVIRLEVGGQCPACAGSNSASKERAGVSAGGRHAGAAQR